MASANKTTNLSLSQFIATDKPSWLSDYNADMAKIDAGYGTAISDSASAVSGAASASAAAQAAQTTANSAQNLANSNKQDIDDIKNALENVGTSLTPLGNATSGGMIVTSSDYACAVKMSIYWGVSLLPNNTVVSGTNTRIPLYSMPNNIFKLAVSTGSDNDNKLYIGNFCGVTKTDSQDYVTDMFPVKAYYDGANTIFYTEKSTSTYSLYKGIRYIFGNSSILMTGQVFNVATP